MRTIYSLISLLAAAVVVLSCENAAFLDRAPISSTAPENFFKNEEQMKLSLVSCYETINTNYVPGASVLNGTYASGLFYIMNGPCDDVISTGTVSGEGPYIQMGIYDESDQNIRQFWKAYFAGINRCNVVLHYIDEIPEIDPLKVIQFKAEARFMRAFFYYHLAWNFGGVPIITNHITSGMEARDSLKKVYDFILEDLDFAYENLQDTKTGGLLGSASANKWAAASYIGRICNYLAACKRYGTGSSFVAQQPLNDFSWVDEKAMTAKAKAALEDVCLNSPYSLNTDWRLNFLELSKNSQYNECIFLSEQFESGNSGWYSSTPLPTPAQPTTCDFAGGNNRHMPTYRTFYAFHQSDARRDWTCTGRYNEGYEEIVIDGHTYAQPNYQDSITVGGVKTEPYPYYDNPGQSYSPNSAYKCCTGKFRLAKNSEVMRSPKQYMLSYPLMRLADVYLMYAEALYFSGDEAGGREWMDKVLRRSCTDQTNFELLQALYYKEDFVDELIESRLRELFMECSHKFDLIRFNRIDAAIADLSDGPFKGDFAPTTTGSTMKISDTHALLFKTLKEYWQPWKIWFPISEEQIGVNPNLVQNAGWSASPKSTDQTSDQ